MNAVKNAVKNFLKSEKVTIISSAIGLLLVLSGFGFVLWLIYNASTWLLR